MTDWKQIQYFLFDFDGTLCDTEPDIKNAWRMLFAKLHCSCPQFDSVFRTGPSLVDMAAVLFPDQDEAFRSAVVDGFGPCYDTSGFPETKPYPGIEAWLTYLRRTGKQLYVVTNKRMIPTSLLIEKMRWNELFHGVYTPDMSLPRRKKAELIASLIKEKNMDPDQVIMIGDTSGDVTAGKANHIKTAGVLWGYGTKRELEDAGADIILSEEDILKWNL